MSATLQLGKLQLAIPKSDLHLTAQATAKFSNPVQSFNLADKFHPLELDWETVRRCWVQRGSGLEFELDLRINGLPPIDTHLRLLGDIVCGAKVQ